MKYKVLFLHGFFNSGQCEMAKALLDCLTEELRAYDAMYAEDEVEVICPDLPPNPYDALRFISETVEREKVDVVAGNSCGAMYAHIVAAEHKLPCLVSNPYYKMSEFLQVRKGTHRYKTERKDGNQTLIIDDALINAFIALEEEERIFSMARECEQFVWGIFGEKDNLAITTEDGIDRNRHERLFLDHYSLSFHFPSVHTPNYEETKAYHVPLVARLIMEFAYYRRKQQEGETKDDKKWRLGAEYIHEFSQFYINKMKLLAEAKDFYRCDIDDDFSHIIYRYRPEGKDKPFYVNEDGSVMYDFLIEYHRGKPSEGIYYGCKAEILRGDMESHADELRNLWPNIFMKNENTCNALQRELTSILNNTFRWKNFFNCYRPTDNICEQRYWLFWITLNDDEDINEVAAVATKLMAWTFMRYFNEHKTLLPASKECKNKQGNPGKSVDKKYASRKRQWTAYTDVAYRRFVEKLGEDKDSRTASLFFYNEEGANKLMQRLEDEGLITANPKYEKGWIINVPYTRFRDIFTNMLKDAAGKKFGEIYAKQGSGSYPEELDYLLMNKKENTVGKERG